MTPIEMEMTGNYYKQSTMQRIVLRNKEQYNEQCRDHFKYLGQEGVGYFLQWVEDLLLLQHLML